MVKQIISDYPFKERDNIMSTTKTDKQRETYRIRRLSTLQPFRMNYIPKDTTRRQK